LHPKLRKELKQRKGASIASVFLQHQPEEKLLQKIILFCLKQ